MTEAKRAKKPYRPYFLNDFRMYKEREKPEIFRTLLRNVLQCVIGTVMIGLILYPLGLFFFTTEHLWFFSILFIIIISIPIMLCGVITCCCSALSGTLSTISHIAMLIYNMIVGLLLILGSIAVAVIWYQFSNIFYWQFFIAFLIPGIIILIQSLMALSIVIIERYRKKYFKNEIVYEPVSSTLVTSVRVEAKEGPTPFATFVKTSSSTEEADKKKKKKKKNIRVMRDDPDELLKEFELDETQVTPPPKTEVSSSSSENSSEIDVPPYMTLSWKRWLKKNFITTPKPIHFEQFQNTPEAKKLERDHKYGDDLKVEQPKSRSRNSSRGSNRSSKSSMAYYNTSMNSSNEHRKSSNKLSTRQQEKKAQKELFMKKEAAGSAWTKFAKKEQKKGIEPSWEKFEKLRAKGHIVVKKKNDVGKKVALFTKMKMKLGTHIDDDDKAILSAIALKYKVPLSDIKDIHKRLKKQYGPELDRKELKSCLNAAKVSKNLLASLSRILDQNGDGSISIAEYLAGMLPLRYGSINEKLDMAFEMFDYDRSANLSKVELYRFVDTFSDFDVPREEKKKMTSNLFKAMDRDHDGEITVDEFKAVAIKDPSIVKLIENMGSKIKL